MSPPEDAIRPEAAASAAADGPVEPAGPAGPAGPAESVESVEADGDGLEHDLRAVLPGFEAVDRDLSCDDRREAELVGRAHGRPVLVLRVDGRDDAAAVRALEALAFGARHGAELALHLERIEPDTGAAGRDPALPAGVVLVSEVGFAPRTLERLRPLVGPDLLLFERRRLASARALSSFLVPVGAPQVQPAPAPAPRPPAPESDALRRFVAALPDRCRETGRDLVERIGRVDDSLECLGDGEGLTWFLGGEPLCRVSCRAGRLEAQLGGTEVPHTIRSSAGVDVFLDWLLAFHLEREDRAEGSAREVELVPPAPERILSDEEIEAFQQ